MVETAGSLSAESRYAIRSALTVLSLMDSREGMPDPVAVRALVAELLSRLDGQDG